MTVNSTSLTQQLEKRLLELTKTKPWTAALFRWFRKNLSFGLRGLIQETKADLAKRLDNFVGYTPEGRAEKIAEFLEQNMRYSFDFTELAVLSLWEHDPDVGILLSAGSFLDPLDDDEAVTQDVEILADESPTTTNSKEEVAERIEHMFEPGEEYLLLVDQVIVHGEDGFRGLRLIANSLYQSVREDQENRTGTNSASLHDASVCRRLTAIQDELRQLTEDTPLPFVLCYHIPGSPEWNLAWSRCLSWEQATTQLLDLARYGLCYHELAPPVYLVDSADRL